MLSHLPAWPILKGVAALALTVCLAAALPPPVPLPVAASSDDHQQARPLADALERGFCSIEADLYLHDGLLLVGQPDGSLDEAHTLQALYLDPLRKRASLHRGRIHRDGPPLLLILDLKTDAGPTYDALREVLRTYPDLLTLFTPDGQAEGAVTVVLTGNRPRASLSRELVRYAALEGKLGDLVSNQPTAFMPILSGPWDTVSSWTGTGPMPDADRYRLQRLVERAHAEDRQIRFVDTPDDPQVWRALLAAQVDYIEADDLDALQAFLLSAASDS